MNFKKNYYRKVTLERFIEKNRKVTKCWEDMQQVYNRFIKMIN